MAVGSAFDAYVKAWLSRRVGARIEFDDLFQKQVEPQNRDWAMTAGASCFTHYKMCGALEQLLKFLEKCEDIRFEFTEKIDPETDKIKDTINGVVLLGKPDLSAKYQSITAILDWKVNGYCSMTGKRPSPGYVWSEGKMHRDCMPMFIGDLCINMHQTGEVDWAQQTSMYAWLVGVPVGGEFICMIDQLAWNMGTCVVAQHRCHIDGEFQKKRYAQYQELWSIINSPHIFRNITLEESISRCNILTGQASVFSGDDEKHQWLRTAVRGQ